MASHTRSRDYVTRFSVIALVQLRLGRSYTVTHIHTHTHIIHSTQDAHARLELSLDY